MSSYEYTDEFGQRLRIAPVEREHPDETPALWFETTDGGFRGTSVKVPLAKLEEAVAGQCDMARQSAAYHQPNRFPGDSAAMRAAALSGVRRRLTELEHTAAWHAIEGTAGEDGADPGTVLAAVLRALGIDPPADTPRRATCQHCRHAAPGRPGAEGAGA